MMQYTGNNLPGKDMVTGTLCAKHPNSLSGKRRQSPLFEVSRAGRDHRRPFIYRLVPDVRPVSAGAISAGRARVISGAYHGNFSGGVGAPGATERLAVENSGFAAILRDRVTLRNKMRIGDRD